MKLNWKFTIVIITAVTIPIAIFAGILFYNLEQNTISENRNYMEYKMDKNVEAMYTCRDSVNMSTQFFLSDDELLRVLCKDKRGEAFTTRELVDFQMTDIKNLERLVSNNPLLYSVRVYSQTDSIQEMMPVLYRHDRMEIWRGQKDTKLWERVAGCLAMRILLFHRWCPRRPAIWRGM